MKWYPWYPFLLLDRLQNVQDLADVAILGLQKRGQPAALVGEAHVCHGLESHLDPGVSVSHLGLSWGDLSLHSRGRGCLCLGEVGVQRALVLGGLLSRLRLNLIRLLGLFLLLFLISSLLGGGGG